MGEAFVRDFANHRTWGDGGGRTRPHCIKDIKISEGWIDCECGERVTRGALTLTDTWDLHRGNVLVAQRSIARTYAEDQATDEEVHDFLVRISDPAYDPPMATLFGWKDALDDG